MNEPLICPLLSINDKMLMVECLNSKCAMYAKLDKCCRLIPNQNKKFGEEANYERILEIHKAKA